MTLIRSYIFFTGMVISTVLIATPLSILGWIMPYRWRCLTANFWGSVNLKLLSGICGLNYTIQGLEHIPKSGAIVLAKHQSAWETIALRALLAPEQAWVLKRELMWVPFFGWALAMVEPIAINRKAGSKAVKQVIRTGIERLNQNRLVIIFPEGTRVAPGQRKKYGIGGALLAEKAQVPVIPLAHNAGNFWRRRDIRKYPGTIEVVIGEPIDPTGKKAAEINKLAEEWIESTMEKLPQPQG